MDISRTVERLRKADRMPPSYDLIYRTTFPSYLIAVQAFNLLTFGVVTAAIIAKSVEIFLESSDESSHSNTSDMKSSKNAENKIKESLVFAGESEEPSLPKPSFEEVIDGGLETFAMFSSMLVFFTIAFVRVQRRLPVRIYVKPSVRILFFIFGYSVQY